MAGRFFVLRRVTDFAPGYFENAAVESGCVQLGRHAGSYVDHGTYTSISFSCEGFFGLIPSWNVDTPKGTSVEMEVRVASRGVWSQWFGFGLWGTYITRTCPKPTSDEIAQIDGYVLSLAEGVTPADKVQMRISLYSEIPTVSPRVYLLAVSTNATQQLGQKLSAYDKLLHLPSYSCNTRDPLLANKICSVTSLCMMMNRYGRDLIPEEVAHCSYDFARKNYDNLSFLCAIAGIYGFSSYLAYTSIPALRREVWLGRAVAVHVHSQTQLEKTGESNDIQDSPTSEDIDSCYLIAIHGFVKRSGAEYVIVSDPNAENDDTVQTELPLASFTKIYTGIALFLAPGLPSMGKSSPVRQMSNLVTEDDRLYLYHNEKDVIADVVASSDSYTLCFTLSDGKAHASTAQRKFHYLRPDENGQVTFDRMLVGGHRMSLFLISSSGNVWVAENQFDIIKEEPT